MHMYVHSTFEDLEFQDDPLSKTRYFISLIDALNPALFSIRTFIPLTVCPHPFLKSVDDHYVAVACMKDDSM